MFLDGKDVCCAYCLEELTWNETNFYFDKCLMCHYVGKISWMNKNNIPLEEQNEYKKTLVFSPEEDPDSVYFNVCACEKCKNFERYEYEDEGFGFGNKVVGYYGIEWNEEYFNEQCFIEQFVKNNKYWNNVIYGIYNKKSGNLIYIGRTINLKNRIIQYKTELKNINKNSQMILKYINANGGINNFEWKIESGDEKCSNFDETNKLENNYIEYFIDEGITLLNTALP